MEKKFKGEKRKIYRGEKKNSKGRKNEKSDEKFKWEKMKIKKKNSKGKNENSRKNCTRIQRKIRSNNRGTV